MPHVDIVGNTYIWVGDYYSKEIPKAAGMRWNPLDKRWETNNLDVAKRLENYMSNDIKNSLKCLEEVNISRLNLSSEHNINKVTTELIDIPVPDGVKYYDYQVIGVNYALNVNRVLIADEMGLGKSCMAIGVINYKRYTKTVIVCPATLTYNWLKELKTWLVDFDDYKIQIISGKNYHPRNANIYIVSYDMLISPKLSWMSDKNIKFDCIIADEAHYLKKGSTQRSKAFKRLVKRVDPNSDKVILLSGTPSLNRPIELYNLLTILKYDIKYFDYINRYCDATEGEFGLNNKGASNLDELQYKLRQTCMIRRLKADVLTELPPKTRQIVYCDPSKYNKLIDKESKLISKSAMDMMEYDDIIGFLSHMDYSDITEMTAYRKATALAKIPDAISQIDDILVNTDKVVVFAHHREVIDKLYEHYTSISSVKLYGGMSDSEKQDAVDRFQTDPLCKIFLGGTRAAGVGITLTAASVALIIEMDWTPGIMLQVEDRIHRIGQVGNVLIKYMVVDGSIDALLAKTLMQKTSVLTQMFDSKSLNNYTPPPVDAIPPPIKFELDISEDVRVYSYIEKIKIKPRLLAICESLPDSTTFDDEWVEELINKILTENYIPTNIECRDILRIMDDLEVRSK